MNFNFFQNLLIIALNHFLNKNFINAYEKLKIFKYKLFLFEMCFRNINIERKAKTLNPLINTKSKLKFNI